MINGQVTINLMLGTACNWNCPYCLQYKQPGFDKKKDPIEFGEKLLDFLRKNNIDTVQRICYWGGEPLLYRDYVYSVEKIMKPIHSIKKNRIITNGSLIDNDFVDFVNEYDMLVNLSYHQGQLTDDKWKTAMFIKRLYVTSLIHHNKLTWDEFITKWQYLYNKFGRCVNWYVYPMRATPGVPEQYWLTNEDVDQYIKYIQHTIDNSQNNVFYSRMLQILFYTLKKYDVYGCVKNKCFNENVLSIDLEGNRYYCHHDCSVENKIGNIFEDGVNITNKTFPINVRSMGEECDKCKMFANCVGGCFRDLTPDVTCNYQKKLYSVLNDVIKNRPFLVPAEYRQMV